MLLTEIKASSVSVAVKMAMENDLGVVFLHNKPKLIGGTVEDLEERLFPSVRRLEVDKNGLCFERQQGVSLSRRGFWQNL